MRAHEFIQNLYKAQVPRHASAGRGAAHLCRVTGRSSVMLSVRVAPLREPGRTDLVPRIKCLALILYQPKFEYLSTIVDAGEPVRRLFHRFHVAAVSAEIKTNALSSQISIFT